MKRYRIVQAWAYSGCIPVKVYWVQVYKDGFFRGEWINVKAFTDYARAKVLCDNLNGK